MNLQTEKIQIAKTLLETESAVLIKQIKAILNSYKTDLWDELSEYQKLCVKVAKEELSKGKGTSHKEVMKKYKKQAYKVIWSPKAEKTFEGVIEYLQSKWTEKQIQYFVERTDKTVHLLANNPYMFKGS